MSQAGVVLDKDQFNCSICLDTLRTPVTIPCGHSYCSACIQNYWDQEDYLGIFMCPQCRQNFSPRPPLARNTMLADVVEKFKKTGLNSAADSASSSGASAQVSPQSPAEAGDVECDVCTGRKNKAVKSCLVCLASYCEVHVQPHFESAAFKKHRLVSATKKLQETICPRHDKLLEMYCRSDSQSICYQCLADEHKGHDAVLAEEEILRKQSQLSHLKQSAQLHIQLRENEDQELGRAILSLTRSARAAADESDAMFTELIRLMELKRFEVRELIKAQEKTAIGQAEQLRTAVQREIAELRKTEAELDLLSHIEDHVLFLKSCQSLHALPAPSPLPALTSDPNLGLGPVMTAMADYKSLLQEFCEGGFVNIYEKVRDVTIVRSPHGNAAPPGDAASAVQVEATMAISPPRLEQIPATNLNPFLTEGAAVPMFALSPFGPKPSIGSRPKHIQRRNHTRRK